MADTSQEQAAIVPLSKLEDGREAECFALLWRKQRGMTKRNEPYIKCFFRDRHTVLEAPLWANHRLHRQAAEWTEGIAYRIRVRMEVSPQYGPQLSILNVKVAGPEDEADGYDFFELVESSDRPARDLLATLHDNIERYIDDPYIKPLVLKVLEDNADAFVRIQAAASFHHSYTSGLLEHVWSMTRICGFLADHYAKYYPKLNPPLNKSVIVAAAILHDIGKIRELEYHPVEAKYTKQGYLIGHVLMGRDMVREAARAIEGFPEETLMLLEHAILAHHGKREFGAPILPQTVEALIVSFVDDLDAKVNMVVRELLRCNGEGEFTDKVYGLDNRKIYRGIPLPPPEDDPPPP